MRSRGLNLRLAIGVERVVEWAHQDQFFVFVGDAELESADKCVQASRLRSTAPTGRHVRVANDAAKFDQGWIMLERAVNEAEAASEQHAWTLNFSPAEAGARARIGLEVIEAAPVPLHSNPGPEHGFVDPDTLRFTGVIDFGDAYLSHPALDFRRWAQPGDRTALMQGYATGNRLTQSFHANWRAMSIIMLMLDFATRPSRRDESLEGLRVLLSKEPD